MTEQHATQNPGVQAYEDYWARQMADPEFRAVYEEESSKKELWLQLVEARQAAGLSRDEIAQRLDIDPTDVGRIEEGAYDEVPLATLRHYVEALGDDYTLVVAVMYRGGERDRLQRTG